VTVVATVGASATPIAPPICWLVLISPEAMPASAGRDAGQRADRHRNEREGEPDSAEQELGEQIGEVVTVHRKLREQHECRRRQRQPDRQHRADAYPGDKRLRDGREHDDRQCQADVGDTGFQVGEDGDLGVELGHGAGRGRGVDDVVFEFLQLVAGQVVEGVVVKGYVSGAAEQDVPTRPLLGQAMARWAGTTVTANVIAWASGVEGLRVALEGKCFRCEALLPLFLRRLRRSKEDAQPTAGLVIQPTSLLRE